MTVDRHLPRTLLTLLAAFVLFVPAATAGQSYPDSAGDAPPGVPDMTGVTVSNTTDGKITFDIAFANRRKIEAGDWISVFIDSDRNKATSSSEVRGDLWGYTGIDYEICAWDHYPHEATIFSDSGMDEGIVKWTNGSMQFTVDADQIGAPTAAFDFGLLSTGSWDSTPAYEWLPHDAQTATYSLAAGGVAEIRLPTTVTTVKAGKIFSVRAAALKLPTNELVTPDTLSSKATIAGKALKPRPGGNAWRVPKKLSGKTTVGKRLVVTIQAVYRDTRASQKLTLRIVK